MLELRRRGDPPHMVADVLDVNTTMIRTLIEGRPDTEAKALVVQALESSDMQGGLWRRADEFTDVGRGWATRDLHLSQV